MKLAWRLALYFALLVGTFWLVSQGYAFAADRLGLRFAHGPGSKPAEAVGLGQARLLIAAMLAWVVTEQTDSDRTPILPLHVAGAMDLFKGLLWGLAAISATIGAIACFGGYKISGFALTGAAAFYYIPLWLAIAVVNGLAENMALMGYPLFRTARATGWLPAILLVSLIFGAAHLGNPGENPLGISCVFLVGVVMATAIWLTGNLWLSAGIHAGIILGEDLVFSVPDSGATYTGHLLASRLSGPLWSSGGSAGPEGSVFALPPFALLIALLWIVHRDRFRTNAVTSSAEPHPAGDSDMPAAS